MSAAAEVVAEAIRSGRIGGRVWFYSNYHCNLACTYCLTESAPEAAPRILGAERMRSMASEAAALGFGGIGVTGGEPFLLAGMPELLADLAEVLPVVVLSNGTLFHGARLRSLEGVACRPVTIQISLDHPDPVPNDRMRGPGNFARVVAAVPRLLVLGLGVRIATTAPPGAAGGPGRTLRRSVRVGRITVAGILVAYGLVVIALQREHPFLSTAYPSSGFALFKGTMALGVVLVGVAALAATTAGRASARPAGLALLALAIAVLVAYRAPVNVVSATPSTAAILAGVLAFLLASGRGSTGDVPAAA